MTDDKIIYFSLDDARIEMRKRWNDVDLKTRIVEELGEKFIPEFKNFPRGITFRQVCSLDNGFTFFHQCSEYVGVRPTILEYHDDMFTHINEEKKGLGRISVLLGDNNRATADIMNFHENEGLKLSECALKTGENLIVFHHNLFNLFNFEVDFLEKSKWFHDIGRASDYYYYLMLHFVAHGILFETFFDEGGSNEDKFTRDVIVPTIKKIFEKFGVKPLIVRLYPANQSKEEEFYWWSYPPYANSYMVDYIKKNNIDFKII